MALVPRFFIAKRIPLLSGGGQWLRIWGLQPELATVRGGEDRPLDLSPLFVKHQSEMQGYRLPGTMTCCSNQKEASSLCRLIPGTIFCSMSISAILTLSTADW
ncbi:hypothetical protein MLD38_035310 [Melastoma candidum]|uniref:Uncharacterized protein n=1 Tax=Melastoma candidum TaxID=119954 RepID=A0ACB9MEE1_9MYRT|nr:hypothetical protein MLD38_035310 [Melastoma candidum]